jgi:hypothetical protein
VGTNNWRLSRDAAAAASECAKYERAQSWNLVTLLEWQVAHELGHGSVRKTNARRRRWSLMKSTSGGSSATR